MMEPSGTTFVAHAAWMGASQARGGRVSKVRRREHGTGAGPHMMNPTSRREDPLLRRSADAMSAQQTARASVHMAAVAAALANARLVDDSKIDNTKVYILSTVKIRNTKNNAEVTYTLVAENEANLAEKKISIDSPIGKGLLGKSVGDIAEVQVPAGIIPFEILEISRG